MYGKRRASKIGFPGTLNSFLAEMLSVPYPHARQNKTPGGLAETGMQNTFVKARSVWVSVCS